MNNTIDERELTKDELGSLLNELVSMQNNVHSLISEVSDSTIQLTAAVEEVSAISAQTALRVQNRQLE
ncbi:hypothetical protein [Vibrio tapetis]|uniref:hypothetical protein n=1 Tax=Vibrio tapetis TaxID=52443 RepID=UPI0011AB690B|nr:hypothetical protein [Vibrio tapetis]